MHWYNNKEIYLTPDEIDSFGNCSLHSSIIKCLNKHYDNTSFNNIPSALTSIITSYTNELFGDINEFETKYRKVRNEFKSKIYTFAICKGVECFYEAYDKGDDKCLYGFLEPRLKTELIDDDDDETYEISCYDDVIEHIRYSHVDCINFKDLFINYSKTIEELILIFYNTIQDYYDYKQFYKCIYPESYKFYNDDTPSSLYYSTEYDSDYDDDEFEEFVEEIHNGRHVFFTNYNTMCIFNGMFEKFYSN
jgi:hypothetical protein